MSGTKDDIMYDVVQQYTAVVSFLTAIANSATSYNEFTPLTYTDLEGTQQTINLPSIGYIKSYLDSINTKFNNVINASGNRIIFEDDGYRRVFREEQLFKTIEELEATNSQQIPIPTEFRAKSNWFFESFLNPLLYVPFNVSSYTTNPEINQFSVQRVIVSTPTSSAINFFDNNFKGKNDLDYTSVITALNSEGLAYILDDNTYNLPIGVSRYKGSFGISQISEDTTVIDGESAARTYYELSQLFCYDISTNKPTVRYLQKGDILITGDDTEYKIISIDQTTRKVLLKLMYGSATLSIGANILMLRPESYVIKELQINVGYNEREIIFVKPIHTMHNISSSYWLAGIGLHTNEMTIVLASGKTMTLEDYYKQNVDDFGLYLLNVVKERAVPALLGVKPATPVITASDLQVININSHITDDSDVVAFRKKVAQKESLYKERVTLTTEIEKLKKQLGVTASSDTSTIKSINKSLDENQKRLATATTSYNSIISDIAQSLKTDSKLAVNPKYRVRGFVAIPASEDSEVGPQDVVTMHYKYRYLSKSGAASNTDKIKQTDPTTGNVTEGYFSNWNVVENPLRKKYYDTDSGTYKWKEENIQDADAINFNQIDIPISKGEIVEIVATWVSEAGYPTNPIESDPSEVVQIAFPDEYEAIPEAETNKTALLIESATADVQTYYTGEGLELHLNQGLYQGDQLRGHKAIDIAYEDSNVFDRIKDIDTRLTRVENSNPFAKGSYKITLTDNDTGVVYDVKHLQTLDLIAEPYKDKATVAGDIISKTYTVTIENSSNGILELVTPFFGGVGEELRKSSGDNGGYVSYVNGQYIVTDYQRMDAVYVENKDYYDRNGCYDRMGVNISESKSSNGSYGAGYLSSQRQGQFVWSRYKSCADGLKLATLNIKSDGVSNALIYNPLNFHHPKATEVSIDGLANEQKGFDRNGCFTVPTGMYRGGENSIENTTYYPIAPTNDKVWNGECVNGTLNYSYTANLSGDYAQNIKNYSTPRLSEFCLHTDHPILKEYAANNVKDPAKYKNIQKSDITPAGDAANANLYLANIFNPLDKDGNEVLQLPLCHSIASSLASGESYTYNTSTIQYYQQLGYTANDGSTKYKKTAFTSGDDYLIGKYTCGAYMYVGAATRGDISVEGVDMNNCKIKLDKNIGNKVTFPITFQYRCQDKLGYVGGFRFDSSPQNIKYTKRLGLNLYFKYSENTFDYNDMVQFDVVVSGSYTKDNATQGTSAATDTKKW